MQYIVEINGRFLQRRGKGNGAPVVTDCLHDARKMEFFQAESMSTLFADIYGMQTAIHPLTVGIASLQSGTNSIIGHTAL